MSVALLIQRPGQPQRLIPVATEHTFATCWAPLCAELGLDLVLAMREGLDITTDNLPVLKRELRMLHDRVAGLPVNRGENSILPRVELALAALDEIDEAGVFEAWVG